MTFDASPYSTILIITVLYGEQYLLFYWEPTEHESSARNMQMNKEKTGKSICIGETQAVNIQPVLQIVTLRSHPES